LSSLSEIDAWLESISRSDSKKPLARRQVVNVVRPSIDDGRTWSKPRRLPDGILGPELMVRTREQATRFGTRVVTDDIVSVDFKRRPFTATDAAGNTIDAHAVVIATGASANYLGLESEGRFKNYGVSACAVCDVALPRFQASCPSWLSNQLRKTFIAFG